MSIYNGQSKITSVKTSNNIIIHIANFCSIKYILISETFLLCRPDIETEKKTQKAIDHFFANHLIAPSPWSSGNKKKKKTVTDGKMNNHPLIFWILFSES